MQSRKEHCGRKQPRHCIFEYIYFARPDSVLDGISVHSARLRAGECLAKAHPVEADLVIGVPDSGLDAALGYSRASGIPYGIGLIKNKYIGRTFIAPDHRLDQVKIKLSAIEDVIRGKRVVLIDDSIVRGTTSGRIVSLLLRHLVPHIVSCFGDSSSYTLDIGLPVTDLCSYRIIYFCGKTGIIL